MWDNNYSLILPFFRLSPDDGRIKLYYMVITSKGMCPRWVHIIHKKVINSKAMAFTKYNPAKEYAILSFHSLNVLGDGFLIHM